MVGQLQWLITLGRLDIQAQVILMSRFRAQPRQGHLEIFKKDLCICHKNQRLYNPRFRTREPDYSYLPDQIFLI